MSRARVTINAAVLATAIWIYACLETNIWAFVSRDDASRTIAKILRHRSRPLPWRKIDLKNINVTKIDMELFEAVGWTPGGASSTDRRRRRRRFINDWHKLRFCGLNSFPHESKFT